MSEFKSKLILGDQGHVNRLIVGNPESVKKREKVILEALGDAFAQKLQDRFGDSFTRFSQPKVITDIIHPGSTIRVDCQSKTDKGDDCSVRVTIGAVRNEQMQWVLEDRPLNMDRLHNCCDECSTQAYQKEQRDNQ
jgi:hypothetical protein